MPLLLPGPQFPHLENVVISSGTGPETPLCEPEVVGTLDFRFSIGHKLSVAAGS